MKALILGLMFSLTLLIPISYAKPPAQSGGVVIREEFEAFWFYSDGNLLVIHGLDLPGSCSGGTPLLDNWTGMNVDIPSDDFLNIVKIKGDDIVTLIYPPGVFEFADDGSIDPFGTCLNLLFDPLFKYPLAAGTVDAVLTDNNFTPAQTSNPRRNAFHLSAHGILDAFDESGQVAGQMVFNGGWNCQWSGSLEDEPRCNFRINLH